MRAAPVGVVLLGVAAGQSEAQRISAAASRWITSPHVMDYRLSISAHRFGPVAVLPFGQLTLQGPKSDGATFVGGGIDLTLRLDRQARPYLIGGVSGGFLDFQRTAGLGLWRAWSAGIGAELLHTDLISAAVEVRYQALSRGATGGPSIGLRLGAPFGSRGPIGRVSGPLAAQPGSPPPTAARTVPDQSDRPDGATSPRYALSTAGEAAPAGALDVVAQARGAMGAPYRWGGTDANGFDCSGLIRYAYQTLGILLPRRSVDQARHGRAVALDLAALAPGDILAFSGAPGGEVSHVGLYLGQGRFIHSASGGVRESPLSAADPEARWWLDRWVGARRVLP